MGATQNRFDDMLFSGQQNRISFLFNACRDHSAALEVVKSAPFIYDGTNYDPSDQIGESIRAFQKATARLNELQSAMKTYMEDFDAMVASNNGSFENVAVENSVFGTFEGILAGSAAATVAAYESSAAYQFYQSGFSFSNDFSDAETYMSEDYFQHFEVLEGMSNISNWDGLTLDLILHGWGSEPTDYSQGLMENALLTSLEMVPGYSVEVGNGDISVFLSELTGMPDLDKEIRKIISWINKHAKDGSIDDFLDGLCRKVSDFLHSIGLGKFADDFIDSISDNAMYLEFYGILAKASTYIVDFAELFLDITMHAAANHLQQTAYLDSIQEALSLGGYGSSGLNHMIGEIRMKLSSEENYIWKSVLDKLDSIANEQAGNLISELGDTVVAGVVGGFPGLSDIASQITPLAGANGFLAAVSATTNVLAGDQVQAVEMLRGIQMYVDPLINTYENYMKLMDMGIASAEDVKQAQNLFELIRVTKMKEYECIQTIDMYGYWHDLAKEKYDQLADWGPAVWEQVGLDENPLLAGRREEANP